MLSLLAPLRALTLLALLSPIAARAHGGHDHGDTPVAAVISAAPRTDAASARFELVAVAGDGELMLFLDRFDTNEPVRGAAIEVETPIGPATVEPVGDAYRLKAPWAATPGDHDLMLTVAAGQDVDFLTARLTIPAPPPVAGPSPPALGLVGAAVAREVGEVVAVNLLARLQSNDPAFIAIGGLGFVLGAMAVALLRRSRAVATVAASTLVVLFGGSLAFAHGDEVHAPEPAAGTAAAATAAVPVLVRDVAQRLPNGAVFAPKPAQRILAIRTLVAARGEHRRNIEMPGRVIADPNASGFVQTAVGGRLRPPEGGFPPLGARVEAGQVLAYVEPSLAAIDQSDIRQAQGALDQEIAIAERQVARFKRLTESGAVSRTQAEDAEITLAGLQARREALERVELQPEPLVAPVAGVIASAGAAPGRIAEPNAVIFHIVDPNRLWIEALSYGREDLGRAASADDGRGGALPLAFVGVGLPDGNQAQPVHFSIEGDAGRVRLGQMVTVVAETDAAVDGIAAPRDAVIRGANGEDIVYVHMSAELFQPRPVRTAPLDGARVLIVAGVEPGERVVTQGSELLNQLR